MVAGDGIVPGTSAARRAVDRQTHRLPTEILEAVIAHLIYDTSSLKACAATCFVWHDVATPHLHHTLTLLLYHPRTNRKVPEPLTALRELDLFPLVKKIRFQSGDPTYPWIIPQIFDSQSLDHFSAFANLQDLAITKINFSKFAPRAEKYFGQVSPNLRSIALIHPMGSPRRLLDFLELFPKLDDIKIVRYLTTTDVSDVTPRASVWGSLRGKLTLGGFFQEEGALEQFVAAFGEMRFVYMDLDDGLRAQPFLDACIETLQTLSLHSDGLLPACKRFPKRHDVRADSM